MKGTTYTHRTVTAVRSSRGGITGIDTPWVVFPFTDRSPPLNPLQVSFGERLSVRIMAARLNQIGVPAMSFDSWTVGLR
jgi:aspartokinase